MNSSTPEYVHSATHVHRHTHTDTHTHTHRHTHSHTDTHTHRHTHTNRHTHTHRHTHTPHTHRHTHTQMSSQDKCFASTTLPQSNPIPNESHLNAYSYKRNDTKIKREQRETTSYCSRPLFWYMIISLCTLWLDTVCKRKHYCGHKNSFVEEHCNANLRVQASLACVGYSWPRIFCLCFVHSVCGCV